MISSILMKGVASYDNEGVTLENMDKVNLIFGSNGTGKTTISSFMKAYSSSVESGTAIPERLSQCAVRWADEKREKILVYNRQFKKENIGKTSIPGVFVMGKDAVDTTHEIEMLEDLLDEKQGEYDTLKKIAANHDSSVLPNGTIYAEYMEKTDAKILQEATSLYDDSFKGLKRDACRRLEKILQVYNELKPSEVLSKEQLDEHISIANQGATDPTPELRLPSMDALATIEKESIWSKAVVGSGDVDFAEFINNLNLSDWVKKGMEKLPHTGDVCPFCQQPIMLDSLIGKLNSYFDASYEKDMQTMKDLAAKYEKNRDIIIEAIRLLAESEHIDQREINRLIESLAFHLRENIEKIDQKIASPSNRITLEDCGQIIEKISHEIAKANDKIRSWNALIVQKRRIKSELPQRVLEYLANKYESNLNAYNKEREKALKKAKEAKSALMKTETEINALKEKISTLRTKSSDCTAVVERINKTLEKHNYKSFKLVSHDESSYRIVRKNGEDASDTLSEGEETLITFLYYLNLLEGSTIRGKDSGDIIAVIDDPISSLDNYILTFIAREIKTLMFRAGDKSPKVKQLIIMTHNIDFHKSLAKAPVNYYWKGDQQKAFYILEKTLGTEHTSVKRTSTSDDIESEYNKMWEILRKAYQKITDAHTEEENKDYKYTIQNTMRRIYETFFSNICGLRDAHIAKLFTGERYSFDDCMNLIEWLNAGSHSVSMNTYIDLPSDEIILEYLEIFKEMFRVTGNVGQFERLMREES